MTLRNILIRIKHSPFLLIGLGDLGCVLADTIWLIHDMFNLHYLMYSLILAILIIAGLLIGYGVYRGYTYGFLKIECDGEKKFLVEENKQNNRNKMFKR